MSINNNIQVDQEIAIAWDGLPAYGASLIRAGVDAYGKKIPVIATKPMIPIEGMEGRLGQKIYWIDPSSNTTWADMNLPVPKLFFHTGWAYPAFNALGKEVRSSGGKVIGKIDNAWIGSLRQVVGALIFRLIFRKRYSAVWVPGKSGAKLCHFLGMPTKRIYLGLYGGEPKTFQPGIELKKRPKRFIFVGQLIKRKGVYALAKSFDEFLEKYQEWELHIYGEGECSHLFKDKKNVKLHGFAQPDEIAKAMREARFLVLPSLQDNWPLVVIEAALSGCGLILSDMVGNGEDIVNEKNGMIFKSGSFKELAEKLRNAATMPEEKLYEMFTESKRLGSLYTSDKWAENFLKIIGDQRAGYL